MRISGPSQPFRPALQVNEKDAIPWARKRRPWHHGVNLAGVVTICLMRRWRLRFTGLTFRNLGIGIIRREAIEGEATVYDARSQRRRA